MKKLILLAISAILSLSLCACQSITLENETEKTPPRPDQYPDEIFATDADKEQWYPALVRLLANQREFEGAISKGGLQTLAYNENEPSIPWGYDMGLFDVSGDRIPELLLNMGGGSAGNYSFGVFDIFSGDHVGDIDGGGNDAWAIYYDIQNEQYIPIGRYDWRVGDSGSMHFVTTISFDKRHDIYHEVSLFYAQYEYDKDIILDKDRKPIGVDLQISDITFHVNGKPTDFQSYHYDLTQFYQTHSLVANTGIRLYYWHDVAEDEDSAQVRAEKMAHMLLFGSGQKFMK